MLLLWFNVAIFVESHEASPGLAWTPQKAGWFSGDSKPNSIQQNTTIPICTIWTLWKLTFWTHTHERLEDEFPSQLGEFWVPAVNFQGCNHPPPKKNIGRIYFLKDPATLDFSQWCWSTYYAPIDWENLPMYICLAFQYVESIYII